MSGSLRGEARRLVAPAGNERLAQGRPVDSPLVRGIERLAQGRRLRDSPRPLVHGMSGSLRARATPCPSIELSLTIGRMRIASAFLFVALLFIPSHAAAQATGAIDRNR